MTDRLGTVWYVSGPHGAGKSTLVERAVAAGVAFAGSRVPPAATDPNPSVRARMNLERYAREHRENLRLASSNAEGIVLGDRCVYDVFAYARARSTWGSADRTDEVSLRWEARHQFREWGCPKNVIFLVPSAATIRLHLASRECEVPWRKDAGPFLDVLISAYHRLYDVLRRSRSHRVRLVMDGAADLCWIGALHAE